MERNVADILFKWLQE